MEFFVPKPEVARRERLSILLTRIDDLMPQEGYVPAQKYTTYSLAPRIRLAAYDNDSAAKGILTEMPSLKNAGDLKIRFADLPNRVSIFGVWEVGGGAESGIGFTYDTKKFRVANNGQYDLRKVKNPDELFNNLLVFVETDLLEGRKAWAEILRKRRQEYFQRNEVGEKDLLRKEIETLVRSTSGSVSETVLFAGESEVQDGIKVIPLYIPADLRTAVNVRLNYEEVRGVMTTATDNEELELDFGQFKFRINRIPEDVGETLNTVEETFSEFMKGNGNFGFNHRIIGNFTLAGLDASYEEATFPLFGEVKAED